MILLPLLFALALTDPLIEQTSFTGTPEQSGWHISAQRPEIAPRGWIDRTVATFSRGSTGRPPTATAPAIPTTAPSFPRTANGARSSSTPPPPMAHRW